MKFLAIIGIITLSAWALLVFYIVWHLVSGRIKRRHFKCKIALSAQDEKKGNTERATVR